MKKFVCILVMFVCFFIIGCGKPDVITTADIFLAKYDEVRTECKKINEDESLDEKSKKDNRNKRWEIFKSEYRDKKIEMTGNVFLVQKSLDGRVFAIIGLKTAESKKWCMCVFAVFRDEEDIRKLYRKQQGKVVKVFEKIVAQKEGDSITVCGIAKPRDEFLYGSKEKEKELRANDKEKLGKMTHDFFNNFYIPIKNSSILEETLTKRLETPIEFWILFRDCLWIDDAKIISE